MRYGSNTANTAGVSCLAQGTFARAAAGGIRGSFPRLLFRNGSPADVASP
jgi:hypothetical protein